MTIGNKGFPFERNESPRNPMMHRPTKDGIGIKCREGKHDQCTKGGCMCQAAGCACFTGEA